MSDDPMSYMDESCAKLSSPEANQAFRIGTTSTSSTRKTGKRKRGHTTSRQQKLTCDENWAKQQPKLTEALEVLKQESAVGQGLFVRKSYKKGFDMGDAIGEYVGERVLEDEYQARMEQYVIEKAFNYIVGAGIGLYVDATKRGNWIRFVNNSHEPNAQFESLVVHGSWRIFLVATEKIRPGEEVTIDYGPEYRTPDQKFVQCFCPSKRCSGVIGVQLEKKAIAKLLLEDIHYQDDDMNVLCAENRVLENQNKQLLQQILMIQPLIVEQVKKAFADTFIPVTDHRSPDVIVANGRIVQALLNQNQQQVQSTSSAANVTTPSIKLSSESSELNSSSRAKVGRISDSSRRSSARLSQSGKRTVDHEADENDRDSGDGKSTSPVKKKKQDLSVVNVTGSSGRYTVSEYSLPSRASKSGNASPSRLQVQRSVTTSPSSTSSRIPAEEADDSVRVSDDDDDIIELVSPDSSRTSGVCALPAPRRTSSRGIAIATATPSSSSIRTSDTDVVPVSSRRMGEFKIASIMTDLIEWYKRLRFPNPIGDYGSYSCPVHRDECFKCARDVRQHFFLKHAGAANTYRQQLETRGESLTEKESKMFAEGQRMRMSRGAS